MAKKTIRNIEAIFWLNFFYAIIQLFGGLITNSISIFIESIRNFGDAIAIRISLILEKKTLKKADNKYTYGYHRFSVIGSLVSTVFMLISSVFAILIIIPRIIHPENVDHEGMFILASIGLIINGFNRFTNYNTNNINEQSINLQQTDDIVSWTAVLITSTVISIYDLQILDPFLSILITVIALKHAIRHLKVIFDIILEKVPDDLNMQDIEKRILGIDGVCDVKYFHIWSLDGIRDYATVYVIFDKDLDLKSAMKIKNKTKEIIKNSGITYSTVEIMEKKC